MYRITQTGSSLAKTQMRNLRMNEMEKENNYYICYYQDD